MSYIKYLQDLHHGQLIDHDDYILLSGLIDNNETQDITLSKTEIMYMICELTCRLNFAPDENDIIYSDKMQNIIKKLKNSVEKP